VNGIKRLIFWTTIVLGAVAVIDQLKRPESERTWHGQVFGIVPYDFRPPSLRRFKDAWWNPDDPRIFTPRDFGIGWAVNVARVFEMLQARRYADGDDGA
jgi:hypothetical protein